MIELDTLLVRLEAALAENISGEDGSHDSHHARRVWINAQAIDDRIDAPLDHEIVLAAVYLHDLVNVPKNAPNRDQASTLSARAARPILESIGFDPAKIAAVMHAIAAHSFSAGIRPETIEAKVVQDADRLESLGALGIARTFYTAGRMGSALFHPTDAFAAHRDLDDRAFAIDHFKTKLLGLSETMQTSAGRAIAAERTAAMRAFLAQLGGEIGSSSPW